MAQQKFPKAYEAYQQAVYRDGRNPTFWCSIGVLYYQINQYRDALDAYSRAIRLNPYISEVWYDLGTLVSACRFLRLATPFNKSYSTSRVTIKPPTLWMHMLEPQSLILPTLTSRPASLCSGVELQLGLTSTTPPFHKMFTLRPTKTVLVFRQVLSGEDSRHQTNSHNSLLSTQHVSTTGQEESQALTRPLDNNSNRKMATKAVTA